MATISKLCVPLRLCGGMPGTDNGNGKSQSEGPDFASLSVFARGNVTHKNRKTPAHC